MKVGFVLPLACALVLKSSLDTSGSLTVDACRLGFTQNLYTVFIPQKQLQGHTIARGRNDAVSAFRRYFALYSLDHQMKSRSDATLLCTDPLNEISSRVNCFCTGANLCVMLIRRFANTPEHMAVLMDGSVNEHRLKFQACHPNEKIRFKSSDPKFTVRPNGSLYAEQDVSEMSQPIEFIVTAQGKSEDTRIWKTVVKLVIARHLHHTPVNQIVKSHQNCYHNLSQRQRGFSMNGLHRKMHDCIIASSHAPENFRGASLLFPARRIPKDVSIVLIQTHSAVKVKAIIKRHRCLPTCLLYNRSRAKKDPIYSQDT
ncbi:Cadherin-4 [Bagarius yarrelli]|uniref:Cadherin-4 n=1 Tax=Bagarius yarrelli TaxID=175774 RepID=A0A556V7W3_BAGYA|nr:Cadherin-4 [Bagarius yarrelli]